MQVRETSRMSVPGSRLNIKMAFPSMKLSMVKIRRYTTVLSLLVRRYLYIETPLRYWRRSDWREFMGVIAFQITGNSTFFKKLFSLTPNKASKFRITGPLWWESISDGWIALWKYQIDVGLTSIRGLLSHGMVGWWLRRHNQRHSRVEGDYMIKKGDL